MVLKKVISGGQAGVDRAALDAAMKVGIPVGGYCPRGRAAEDGVIPEKYHLTETVTTETYYRTEQNVIHSGGTLILNRGELSSGTKLTRFYTVTYGKPSLIVQLDAAKVITPQEVMRWVEGQFITTLNIAGPRESKCPGIYQQAYDYLEAMFELMKA